MSIWTYVAFPVTAAVLGAIVAAYRAPGATLVSAIQHFTAGVVFAAAAGEILPDLKHHGYWPVLIGGSIGVATMLLVKALESRESGPVGLAAAVGVDVFIDGLVLGLASAAGRREGLLLTIALTLEILFLGLTVTAELNETAQSKLRTIGTTVALTMLLPMGALCAEPVSNLPQPIVTAFFAFGLVALLYLVTEELLVEAHEIPDRPWVTAMFFAGFLLLLMLEDAVA